MLAPFLSVNIALLFDFISRFTVCFLTLWYLVCLEHSINTLNRFRGGKIHFWINLKNISNGIQCRRQFWRKCNVYVNLVFFFDLILFIGIWQLVICECVLFISSFIFNLCWALFSFGGPCNNIYITIFWRKKKKTNQNWIKINWGKHWNFKPN